MSAGFTKGPWEIHVESDGTNRFKGHAQFIIGNKQIDEGVCEVHDYAGSMGPATARANANLIAAAPDLYEVLASLEYQLGGETDAVKRRFADVRAKARAALWKAEGKQ